MKKIIELKNERSKLIADMEAILNKAQVEKRSKSDEENTAWTEKNERVNSIDAEIKQLERQEELNRSVVTTSSLYTEEEKVSKRYDLGKAIREARKGNLTGLEAEMHQEAERELRGATGVVGNIYIPSFLIKRANEETKTTGAAAGHIPTQVAGLDLNVPTPLYRELGVTVYENLTGGKLELPFSQGFSAAKVDETSGATQSIPTNTKGTLSASRFQGWQSYTQEYLAETAVLPSMLSDMVAAIDRGIGKQLVADAADANVMSGFTGSSGNTVAVNYAGVLDMMSELTVDDFVNQGFVMSKELFYALASTLKATGLTSGNYIVENLNKYRGMIAGVPAFGTSFLAVHDTDNYDIIFGDWKRAYVGMFGGVQLLVDPYTASDTGLVKITFSRMADTAVNPYTFASKRNVGLS